MLMDLRNGGLQNEELRIAFFKKIIASVSFDDNYVILIGCDRYDVPFKSKDGETQTEASEEVYTYLLCAVCPVKLKKPGLQYVAEEKEFHDGGTVQEICAPEVGFLFPAFDNRGTNIYNALLYTHSPKISQQSFSDAVFCVGLPMPAEEQKKSFEALLTTSLADECSLRVVQTVHEQICQQIEIHKEGRIAEPLLISKEEVKTALKACGVSEPSVAKFSVNFDETFGNAAELHPKNIIDNRSFEIHTPDVSIKVNPDCSDLIETRVIGGVKYIMICADADVEVNGVSIRIDDEQTVKA